MDTHTSKHFHCNVEMRFSFKFHFFLVGIDPGWHGCHCQLSFDHSSVVPLTQCFTDFNLFPRNLPCILICIVQANHLGNKQYYTMTVLLSIALVYTVQAKVYVVWHVLCIHMYVLLEYHYSIILGYYFCRICLRSFVQNSCSNNSLKLQWSTAVQRYSCMHGDQRLLLPVIILHCIIILVCSVFLWICLSA